MNKRTFAPWRVDYKHAIQLYCMAVVSESVGMYCLYLSFDSPQHSPLKISYGVLLVVAGISMWVNAKKLAKKGFYRRNGARVEFQVVKELKSALSDGWFVMGGVGSMAGGDIDVVLQKHGACFAVEIKSATSTWGLDSFFRRLLGLGIDSRAKKAVDQAMRNARSIDSDTVPILWLPMAKKFTAVYKNVRVVGGSASYLARLL